ncbi:MAG: potassium transporter [Epsilonproteobacteria bacterium]|nr:potassium transporter [Campylobacterota bacterium]
MEVIIAGAGKVGFNLARTLSIGHNVTVIDRNMEALNRLQETLDILPLCGDIEDPETYRKLAGKEADLFIAVTDLDEANLVSSLIVDDEVAVGRKIIRLRNEMFARSGVGAKLGLDAAVFPLRLTSDTVLSLLAFPAANNVKHFQHIGLSLVSVRAASLGEPQPLERPGEIVVGIERGKRFFVPEPDEKVEPGDLVYLFGDGERIGQRCLALDKEAPRHIGRCVVFGAGELGVTVASRLLAEGREVKLVDKDPDRCERADERLGGRAMTFSCKYGTAELFEEEGLGEADMMVAATDNDEYNIIKCLEAREHGVRKVVAINNEMEYYNLMHALGIVVVRGPKMSAYHAILERINSGRVTVERKYCGGRGTVFVRTVHEGSKTVGKKIKPPRRVKGRLFLVREGEMTPLREPTVLRESDTIVGFCETEAAPKMKVWFYEF